jgi:glycogen operon protein
VTSPAQSAPAVAGTEPALGSTVTAAGVHFGVFSTGDRVELLLFDRPTDERPSKVIELERSPDPSRHYWQGFVGGIGAGQAYGYRVGGPLAPSKGLRFDSGKLLLDPYARAIATPRERSRDIDRRSGKNVATALRSVVVDWGTYDWAGDRAPRVPRERSIIYEMHVGQFTGHPSSPLDPELRGTFAGIVQRIPYLVDLGITAVELMPVFAFDEQAAPRGLRNVWGYQPLSFFALHERYASRRDPGAALEEFRDMTRALHRAGIEVILDVVYNHSAEEDALGPTISFRGLANEVYYLLGEDGEYVDYSGCGNTLNVNSPVVLRLILDSLRFWVSEMHVDGFRFDLAGVLLRDGQGKPEAYSPILRAINSDPILKNVKLIAEAWDAAGLDGLGRFAGHGWSEWNGRFRDDVRRFLKSDDGTVRHMASRLAGSPDIYPAQTCAPVGSVNFVTSHDGFTLNDLVSYNCKHNEDNGEDNRDGTGENHSWNCGIEGPSEDESVNELRTRQIKNFLVVTLLATGVPMLLMGDEVRRTQSGNNNGYCLGEQAAGLDWEAIGNYPQIHRFVRGLVALRAGRLSEDSVLGAAAPLVPRTMEWHGVRPHQPDWGEQSHSLATRIGYEGTDLEIYLIVNAYWESLQFELPVCGGSRLWRRCVDTSLAPPEDLRLDAAAPLVTCGSVLVQPRSVVVLLAPSGGKPEAQDGA